MTDYDMDLLPWEGSNNDPISCGMCKWLEPLEWHGSQVGWLCTHCEHPYEQREEEEEACGDWEQK